jgi:[ribosomal protein S18]-alanine N-acetyltransferase
MDWSLPTAEPLGDDQAYWVRAATPDDAEALVAIERAAHSSPWPDEVFDGEFELDWSYIWGVCERPDADAAPVAMIVFWVIHDEIHLLNVAVCPDHQRRGIATRLLVRLAALGRQQQASFITLEVREHNEAAIALYESLGFAIIGQRERYYADTGEDALIMSWIL